MRELTAEQTQELHVFMILYRGLHFRELFVFLKNANLKTDLVAVRNTGEEGNRSW